MIALNDLRCEMQSYYRKVYLPLQPLNMSMLGIYLVNLLGKDNHEKENQTYYLAI